MKATKPKKSRKKIVLSVIAVLVIGYLLKTFGVFGGPYMGWVVEKGTEKPIAGAIVVARSEGEISALVHTQSVCYHVMTTTTNENGWYFFPPWIKMPTGYPIFNRWPSITAYKPGYKNAEWSYIYKEYLEPFTGTRKERLEYLKRVAIGGCSSDEENEKELIIFNRALLEEAQRIAVTKEDRKIVNSLRFYLDLVELGGEEAQRRIGEGWYLE